MFIRSDKDQIPSYFRYPCQVIQTRGTQEGMILKFATFYLKIYDDENQQDSYIVEGYRYDSAGLVFKDRVPASRMREYAAKF